MSTSGSVASSPPKLKEYVFIEKLGSGTYATVYKAYRKGGPREVVAIKCVQKTSLNRVSTENLLTEIELLKTLKHENIVELKDFQWDDQYIYLIMEYCSGGDLSAFIQSRRTLSEYMARLCLQQLALALQYMRTMNVSHMDLKPQNVLLAYRQSTVLKVGDFGFAHYLVGDTSAHYLRGSPLYMAPEIITKRHYNEKADLWSVGVIMYECLFGRAPFHSKSLKELEKKITDSKPIELPYGVQVSDKCRDLLHGLLKREPDQRISFDDFFQHPFIDLEHRPSEHSLPKARDFVTKAVTCDTQGDYKQAVNLYCRALEHFVPAVHFEKNAARKESMRSKIREYMRRAEDLKQLLKPSTSATPQSLPNSPSSLTEEELAVLSDGSQELAAALTVIKAAEKKEAAEEYKAALAQYELALEALFKVVQEVPKGAKKDILQSKIPVWLSRAEAIKDYLKVCDLETKDTSVQEEEDSSNFIHGVMESCTLQ